MLGLQIVGRLIQHLVVTTKNKRGRRRKDEANIVLPWQIEEEADNRLTEEGAAG